MGPIKQKVGVAVGDKINIVELDGRKSIILETLPLLNENTEGDQTVNVVIEDMAFSVKKADLGTHSLEKKVDDNGVEYKETTPYGKTMSKHSSIMKSLQECELEKESVLSLPVRKNSPTPLPTKNKSK